MTAQVHEILTLEGTETSMAFCPPLPKNNPRLIESVEKQGIITACWRGYVGSWEIKNGKFFLNGVRGKYQLSDGPPILADWFTGVIKIPKGDILRYVHGGFETVYEQELHIVIKDGFVVEKTAIDNCSISGGEKIQIDGKTDFGVVSNYINERGFGFIRGLLLGNKSEIFFHIKTIKKTDPQLAARLSNEPFSEDFRFWFETEITPKGEQVCTVFPSDKVRKGAITSQARLVESIESYWRDLRRKKPSWLEDATSDLVGRDRANELSLEREHLEAEEQRKRELERKESEAREAIEREKRQQQLNAEKAQEQLEEDEFQSLVSEMKLLGITHSSQVSNYIVSNRLGYKYKNISGILQMELDGTTWNFKGGFPPKIYAKLCEKLGLSNNGTKARAVAFESFGNIEERNRRK